MTLSASSSLLIVDLVHPDVLTGEAELLRDVGLGDVPLPCFVDGAAERKTRCFHLLTGVQVGVACGYDVAHRVWHSLIVTHVLATWSLARHYPAMRALARPSII